MRWLVPAVRVVLGGTFLYAGIAKASASRNLALALAPFLHLPPGTLVPLALALIAVEILTGILLIAPRVWPLGALAALTLSLVYAGVISWGVLNGIIVACGCFGADETPSVEKMELAIARDLVLAGMALLILILSKIKRAAAPGSPAPPDVSSRH